MKHVAELLRATTWMFVEAAPWLLAGLIGAGVLKVWVPARWILAGLGGSGFRSVWRASLLGIPLPLCSCSVLPTAAQLRRSGAGRGATTSFLIATPETGVDSIGVTWALLDPLFTVLRPFVALLTALLSGHAVNVFTREGGSAAALPDECAHDHGAEHEHDELALHEVQDRRFGARLRAALRYGLGPLLDDLAPWLLIGFAVSGAIVAFVPPAGAAAALPSGVVGMLLAVLVGTPLYVCATASTPIAAALVAKGLAPGAALVFLLVGPATNVSTILVIRRLLGGRALAIYLATITLVAVAAGVATDRLYAALGADALAHLRRNAGAAAGAGAPGLAPLAWACALVLALAVARSLARSLAARRRV